MKSKGVWEMKVSSGIQGQRSYGGLGAKPQPLKKSHILHANLPTGCLVLFVKESHFAHATLHSSLIIRLQKIAENNRVVIVHGFSLVSSANKLFADDTTYIRPILEYNSIVWNPTYIHLIDLVENVQRNFTKRIPSLSSLPYTERLALLDLDLLELRRLRFDLIYYFKVLHNLTPFEPSNVFIIYYPSERSRSELPYLQKPVKATNKLLSTLFYRNVDAWNALPASLRLSSSLPKFKRGLMKADLSLFLKGSAV
jgi:hypothetical protein